MGKSSNGGSSNAGGAREGRSRAGGGGGASVVPNSADGFPDFADGFRRAPNGVDKVYFGEAKKAVEFRAKSIPVLKEVESKISVSNVDRIHADIGKYGHSKSDIKKELESAQSRLSNLVNTNYHKNWIGNPAKNKASFITKIFNTNDISSDITAYL